MHLSTPGERQSKPPTDRKKKPAKRDRMTVLHALLTAPIGGWRGFLVNAVVWAAVTWGVTRCLNALCSPDQSAGRPADPLPAKQERLEAQAED